MNLSGSEQVLVVLNAPPELEEPVIDWLLARDSGTGFTSFPVFGHSTDHDNLSAVEQVTGRKPRHQFQVQMHVVHLDSFMHSLRTSFGAADLHYWVMPVFEGNVLFGTTTMKYTNSGMEDKDKESLLSWGLGAGIAIPISKRLTFDMLVNYNSYTSKEKENNEENYRMVTGTFGVKFGFIIFLGNGNEG